jgi:hypothetical protein
MIFKYRVNWYEEYTDTEKVEEGLVWADSYGQAANNVIADYGKDLVIDMYLKEIVMNTDDVHCIAYDEIIQAFERD